MTTMNPAIGLIGAGVIGSNLARNFARHGVSVVLFGRHREKLDQLASSYPECRFVVGGAHGEAASLLPAPRIVFLMVPAGSPVDMVKEELFRTLQKGDTVIDGGNSFFRDTMRRTEEAEQYGIHWMGVGISGGASGALNGPSIMPGGTPESWAIAGPLLQKIAADFEGEPCCCYVGPDGAGHYVKMVHNGIEYAEMELLSECYFLLRKAGLSCEEAGDVFDSWQKTPTAGYLSEICAAICRKKDSDGLPLLEKVLDRAAQKGTGSWMAESVLQLGVPVPTLAEAVFFWLISAEKELRLKAQSLLPGPQPAEAEMGKSDFAALPDALLGARLCCYAQGFSLLKRAGERYSWHLNLAEIAGLWRNGCIIRSQLLEPMRQVLKDESENLLLSPQILPLLRLAQDPWRKMLAKAAEAGIPLPGFSSALQYYDALRCGKLPSHLLQAMRDCFGAHTFERIDRPQGTFFHADWED